MDVTAAADLVNSALQTALVLALPALAALFVASLLVSVLQALTQVQDQTLSVVPRLVVGGVALLFLLPWMLDRLSAYTVELYQNVSVSL
jgi:flagellar biosynthetic protein FliQ